MAGACDQNGSNKSGCDNFANKSDGTRKLGSIRMRWLGAVENNLLNAESGKSKSYLEDRHQRIKLVNNDLKSCSSWGIVEYGVPQDSVLGPLLFLFYSNDIMKIKNTKDNNNKYKLVLRMMQPKSY